MLLNNKDNAVVLVIAKNMHSERTLSKLTQHAILGTQRELMLT